MESCHSPSNTVPLSTRVPRRCRRWWAPLNKAKFNPARNGTALPGILAPDKRPKRLRDPAQLAKDIVDVLESWEARCGEFSEPLDWGWSRIRLHKEEPENAAVDRTTFVPSYTMGRTVCGCE